MKKEKWKTVIIDDSETDYQISNFGRIKSFKRNHKGTILKPSINQDGYCQSTLSIDNREKTVLIHRLVAFAFVKGYEPELEVNHKNGKKRYNHELRIRF